jgi:hypothetical protein
MPAKRTSAEDPGLAIETEKAPEPSNRCLPVTDKGETAWQKRAARCHGDLLKSVYREMPRLSLDA